MRVVTFERSGKPSYGLLSENTIVDVGSRVGSRYGDLRSVLAAGALPAPRDVARRISRASAARSAAGVDRRREAIGGGGSGGPKRRFQS